MSTEIHRGNQGNMGLQTEQKVEKLNGKQLSYSQFVEKYLAQNQPVILTGLMEDWRACKDWVSPDGKPNFQFLSTHFGKSNVQVADCGIREFTDQKRVEMSVSEFIERWVDLCSSRDSGNEDDGKSLLYLKDWHLVKEYPEYSAYKTPSFFSDDWLNMYLDKYCMHTDPDSFQEKNEISCSDYRFVYMGAKGTWTPLHADVFMSYSWSANVCGKKKWFFLPPNQCHLVFDQYMKNSVYNIFEDVSEKKFPGFKKAVWWECTQEQNEIIFVPSGWYHQVHNLEDTISINHNWFNGYNISWVWDLLLRDYKEARDLIEDIREICDDFEGLCQRNLAANTGMNFYDIFIFMVRFAFANLYQLCHFAEGNRNPAFLLSQRAQHMVFNLRSIKRITLKMKSVGLCENQGILSSVKEILEDHSFLDMCATFEETYMKTYGQLGMSSYMKPALLKNYFDISDSRICTPEDLLQFIDYTLRKLAIDPDRSSFSGRTGCNLEALSLYGDG